MVSRIYVEKKPGFDVEAQQLKGELTEILGIKGIEALRIINRYDVEGIDEELFRSCVPTVFSEPQVDVTYDELPASDGAVFAVEFLPGQFDQRADSASECVQLISQGERPAVRSAKVYIISGALDEAAIEAIKHYVVNPVEARIASLDLPETLYMETPERAFHAAAQGRGARRLPRARRGRPCRLYRRSRPCHGRGGHRLLPAVLPR